MMRRSTVPRWVWGVLVWLVVVAATSSLAWLAISRAGDEVLAAPPQPLTGTVANQVPDDAPDASGAGAGVSTGGGPLVCAADEETYRRVGEALGTGALDAPR